MKKSIYGSFLALAIAIGAFAYTGSNTELSDLCMLNIEALSDPGESGKPGDVGLLCNGSCIEYCREKCPICYTYWVSGNGYVPGGCTKVIGVCTCGHHF